MLGAELLLKALEALESKALHINPMQCSRFRHQLSKCQLCIDHCPPGAISWDESLDINADKCTGCSICTNVCPNGVFAANNPTNDSLLSRAAAGIKCSDQITFVCSKHQQEADPSSVQTGNILIVPCLGRVDESLLVSCVSLGANSVWLVDGLCRDCKYRAWDIVQQTVNTANRILSMFGAQKKVSFSIDIPGWGVSKGNTKPSSSPDLGSEQYARRDFFKAMTRGTQRAAMLAAGSIIDDHADDSKTDIRKSGLPFYLPQKRVLLLESMKKLGKPIRSNVKVDNLPFWQLKIEDNCTGCGMCAYFCPTGALKKAEDGEKTTIAFQLSNCTGCNLCQEICYKRAISASTNINPEKLLSDKKDILFVTNANRLNLEERREFLGR